MSKYKKILSVIFLTILISPFQNCSNEFIVSSELLSSKSDACEGLSCDTVIVCEAGFSLNTDQTECLANQIACDAGYTLSPDASSCIENPLICDAGFTISADGTSCIENPLLCDDGYSLSMDGSECLEDPVFACDMNQTNQQSCSAPHSTEAYRQGVCNSSRSGYNYGACIPTSNSCILNYHFENGACVADITGPPSVEINAQLSATRLSGVAPLAILFDATATTHANSQVNVFNGLRYNFNFGDSDSGNWRLTQKSKNQKNGGPIAAHVFKTPGNYTVSVNITDSNGNQNSASVNVTVTDASASDTVCLSTTNNMQGCPTGATQMTSISAWPNFQSNTRYLVRSNENYTALGGLTLSDRSGVQLMTFGNGSKPRVTSIMLQTRNAARVSNNVIAGLELNTLNIREQKDVLVMNNQINGAGGATDFHLSGPKSDGVFIVDNDIMGNSNYALYLVVSKHIAVLGNDLISWGQGTGNQDEAGLRVVSATKSIIAHNAFRALNNGSTRKALLKLHSNGLSEWSDVPSTVNTKSSQIIVADNIFGSQSGSSVFKVTVCPQQDSISEGLEDIIIENNTWEINGGALRAGGRRITRRGNTGLTDIRSNFHMGGTPSEWNQDIIVQQP